MWIDLQNKLVIADVTQWIQFAEHIRTNAVLEQKFMT